MAKNKKYLMKQVDQLAARLERLETELAATSVPPSTGTRQIDSERYCSLPEVPVRTFGPDVSPHRARLLVWLGKKWVNGTKLRYYFFESGSYAGANDQQDMVRQGFQVWKDVGIGISFEEVSNITDAEVRIGFLKGDGAWSYVGRDIIDIPGQYERTMNFGWDLTRDPRGVDTPVHEIGHTLGFPHEHQNPFSGIVWDEDAVYDYFGAAPNSWPRQTTFRNVLQKLPASAVQGSKWDPDSIMHYAFPAGLIVNPKRYRSGLSPKAGLSGHDVEQVRRFYPPLDDTRNPQLEPYKSELLTLAPGEQKNFCIQPKNTADYTIQTFGKSDTVIVLFEDVGGGQQRYVAGDDDSGTDRNARIVQRLRKGGRYVLRIRLYLNYASGDTAVMMW